MDNDTRQQRLLLSYQDAKYTRLLVYIGLFLLSYGYIRFSRGSESGVPLYEKAVLVLVFVSFFMGIFEALFILNAKLLYKRVEFDADNLYLTVKGNKTIVPLGNIWRIDMLSSGRGSRGTFYGYEISYKADDGNRAWVYVTVYWKKVVLFDKFTSLVREQNPSVEVKRVTTSIDGIIRLFKRKKQAV